MSALFPLKPSRLSVYGCRIRLQPKPTPAGRAFGAAEVEIGKNKGNRCYASCLGGTIN